MNNKPKVARGEQLLARWMIVAAIAALSHNPIVVVLAIAASMPFIAGETREPAPRHDIVRITAAGDVKRGTHA